VAPGGRVALRCARVVGADVGGGGVAEAVEDGAGDRAAGGFGFVAAAGGVVGELGLIVIGAARARARGGDGVIDAGRDELSGGVVLVGRPADVARLGKRVGAKKLAVGRAADCLDRLDLPPLAVVLDDRNGIDQRVEVATPP